jgi:hypothetical protein
LYAQGEEVVVWVLLQLAALAKRGEAIKHPLSTPSSSLPVYEKEPSKQRRQKSGAKKSHRGAHRSPPQKITHHQEHHVVLRVFNGIFMTDFWGASNAIVCAGKQKCLVHLLRELKNVTKYKDKTGD